MSNLLDLSFWQVREKLNKKEFTTYELISAYIARMEQTRHLNAYLTETSQQALEQAKASDLRIQKGEARPLEGLPLAIKDNFCTKDILTTVGSHILENFIPPYESTVTQKLQDAGSIGLGKTNMDEFAMGSSTENSYFGPVLNPWKCQKTRKSMAPGGSSGGSAAAVAAKSALVALGTDTGGSIRQPAAFCGNVGLKPTYGRCSRYGIVAFASSLDQAGPMARTIRDAALVFQHMAGHDPKDSTSLRHPAPNVLQDITGNIKGLKIGIPQEYRPQGLNKEINAYWDKTAEWLKQAGAEIVDISLPSTEYGLPTYYIIAPAEASSNLSRYDGVRYGRRVEGTALDELYENTRTQGFGPEVTRRILIGTFVLSVGHYDAYFTKALEVRRLIRNELKAAFQKVDAILTPTTPAPAFAVGEKTTNPLEMYLSDVFTVASNLAGVPALSIPVGLSETGLPLGMQLIGPDFSEGRLFNIGSVIEEAAQMPSITL